MKQQKLNLLTKISYPKTLLCRKTAKYKQCPQQHNSYFRIFFQNCENGTAEALTTDRDIMIPFHVVF